MSDPVGGDSPSGPSTVLDATAALVLTGLALLGLASTFHGWGYWFLGMAGAAAGAAVVLLTLRLPVALLLAALPLGAIVLGGCLDFRDGTAVLQAPTPEAMADVMVGAVTGWGELLGTLPFVDLAGPPALVPFLLGYVGAAVSLAVARRSRSVGGPVLPLFAVLAVVLLLRRPRAEVFGWYLVVFAVVALVWAAARSVGSPATGRRRAGAQPPAGRGGTSAVAAGVMVLAALAVAVPLTSSTSGARGENLRGRAAQALDTTDLDSPLRRFRTFTEQEERTLDNVHDKLLFTVRGAPRRSRVRLVTLDRYDGREWVPGNDTMQGTSDDAFLRMDSVVDNDATGPRARVQVTMTKNYRSAWVPTVGSLTSWRFVYADRRDRRQDLRYNLATSTTLLPNGLAKDDSYEFTAILPRDRLTRSMRPWPGEVLEVAGEHRADRRLRGVLNSPAAPMEKVFRLARFLRQEGRYSNGGGPGETTYPAGHDLPRLMKRFLLAPRPVGDDEQYAAAMAILANRVGVPARVVVGAVVPGNGRVRGADVHAWVELRVADGSWRTLPTDEFMGDRPPQPEMAPAPRPTFPPAALPPAADQPSQAEEHQQQRQRDEGQEERRSVLVRVLPWVLVLLLAVAVPVAKLLRRALRRRRGRPSDRVAGAWSELVDHGRELGLPVRAAASRPAQARALALTGALPDRADAAVFGPEEPGEVDVARFWTDAMTARRVLGEKLPRRRRVWAVVNPVTLVRPHGRD